MKLPLEEATLVDLMRSDVQRIINKYRDKKLPPFYIAAVLNNSSAAVLFCAHMAALEKHTMEKKK
jgi:hypothetical protein